MKRLMMLKAMLLLSALLVQPALAVENQGKAPEQIPGQQQKLEHAKQVDESDAFKRQQAYVEKRDAMKQRRDEALKTLERNLKTNNPGNTGL